MNRLIRWAKRPLSTTPNLPIWFFEPLLLKASPDQRGQQRREIQALVRRAHAARSVR